MLPNSVAPKFDLFFFLVFDLSVLIGITKCRATRGQGVRARLRHDDLDLCSQSTSALSGALRVGDDRTRNFSRTGLNAAAVAKRGFSSRQGLLVWAS